MRIDRTDRFDEEAERFRLRFTCEDCGHFAEATERCRNGWPTELHRRARYERPRADGDAVVFCKEFDVR